VVRTGEKRVSFKFLRGNQKDRDSLEDRDSGGKIMLKLILMEWNRVPGLGLCGSV